MPQASPWNSLGRCGGAKRKISLREKWLIDHLIHLFQTPLHSFGQPFIVSFCEEGDLLSQWRAYGSMSGFSLAFSPLSRKGKIKPECKHGFRTMVRRVIYEPEQQLARLHFLFKRLIKLVNGFSFTTMSALGADAHVELSILLILEMTDWACTVKHQSFAEEKEWRVVTYPKAATLRECIRTTTKVY
jgi:hypothetical protein